MSHNSGVCDLNHRCIMKWFFRVTIILLVMLSAAFLVLRFAPNTLLPIANWATGWDIQAESISINYFPAELKLEQFSIADQQQFVELDQLDIRTSWQKLFNKQPFSAELVARNGSFKLNSFPSSQNQQATQATQTLPIPIFKWAKLAGIQVDNVRFEIDAENTLTIHQFSNFSDDDASARAEQLEIQLDADYQADQVKLTLKPKITLQESDDGTRVDIQLAKLDLVNLLNRPAQQSNEESNTLKELSWAWMDAFSGIELDLNIGEMMLPNATLEDFNTLITLSDRIINKTTASVTWSLDESSTINDKLELDFNLKPLAKVTQQTDVEGVFSIQSKWLSAAGQGELNLNGLSSNQLQANLSLQRLPPALNKAPELSQQFLPLNMQAQISSTEAEVLLSDINTTLGGSDLTGEVNLALPVSPQPLLKFDLRSSQFSYQPPPSEMDKSSGDEPVNPPSDAFLSTKPIDWSWLGMATIDGKMAIRKLNIGPTQIDDLSLPIVLKDQNLNIDSASAKLNGGSLKLSSELSAIESGASGSIDLQFEQVDMSESGLFNEGQIEGGLANGYVKLSTQGLSVRDLAKEANGNLYANIGTGKIAQGSFEVLGSDLILGTLSKLNPFSKSDPFTELECGVINLEIQEGVIQAKNSIALETSKVAILGTGNVNLGNEKIDFRFKPKAKKSLGANLGSLAKAVKLGGTLSKPKPELSGLGLMQTGLSVGAAVSTGGLSLLAEGLVDDFIADGACRKARAAFNPAETTPETIQKNVPQNTSKEAPSMPNDAESDSELEATE